MSLWDVFVGHKADTEEAIKIARELAKVSFDEDHNLALHTQLCARRFETLVTLIAAGIDNSRANRALLILLFVTLLVTKALTIDGIVAAVKTVF